MSARAPKAGARPIESTLAPMLAIADALSNPEATIAPAGVAYLLGVSEREAADLIDEVQRAAEGAGEAGGATLPLSVTEGGELYLASPTARRPKALRLTMAEAQAVEELLEALGVDDEAFDGVRPAIARAFYPAGFNASEAPGAEGGALPAQLAACLDALACHRGLTFTYEGQRRTRTKRRVEPLSLGFFAGEFTLVALDLNALGALRRELAAKTDDAGTGEPRAPLEPTGDDLLACRRFFRVRRIGDPRSFKLRHHHEELRELPWDAGNRWARLYFTDRCLFEDYEDWTWARPVLRSRLSAAERRRIGPDGLAVDVCLFEGSPYLARLIVSCGGACTTDDPEIRAQVAAYLRKLP